MPTFTVRITVNLEYPDIEANTPEEAEVKAMAEANLDVADIPLYEFDCDIKTTEQVA